MERESERRRKGRRDQDSLIERGDMGGGAESETCRGIKRGAKTNGGLFIIVILQIDDTEEGNSQDDRLSFLLKRPGRGKKPKDKKE